MPKSIAISLAVSLLGTLLFALTNLNSTPPITEQTYVSVGLGFFNATAIICLFVILYQSEKESADKFGETIRDNIATVIVALLINLISTVVELLGYF